tara:strand:+ start:1488 stop:2402 length:915 start_codon:yes stop_codon:yes gene_type:complete
MADFTGNSIQNTYQKVLQLDTGSIQDGLGNVVNIPTNQLSGSTLLSSSAQIASQISGSFNAASGGLASRVASQETFSSSLNTTFATDAEVTAVSNSLVTTIAVNTTNIGTLTSFTGSYASTSSVNNLTDATSSYAVTNQVNSFSSGQKITGSLIQSGAASFFQGTLNIFSAQTAGALANINSFIDSNGGSTQVFSGLQMIDQGGDDAKMEINSFTGLDGTNPVFRLLGGGSGSNADNTILRSFKDGTLEVTKTMMISSSKFLELQPTDLPASANTGSLAVTGSTLAFYDGNNWKVVVTGSNLPL